VNYFTLLIIQKRLYGGAVVVNHKIQEESNNSKEFNQTNGKRDRCCGVRDGPVDPGGREYYPG